MVAVSTVRFHARNVEGAVRQDDNKGPGVSVCGVGASDGEYLW